MATCVAVLAGNGNLLQLDPATDPTTCAYLLISSTDYQANLNVNALFTSYLAFDPALFGTLITAFLLSFVTGHTIGKILAGLRRV